MHEIRWVREHPDEFDRGLARRGLPPRSEEILALDRSWRAAETRVDAVSYSAGVRRLTPRECNRLQGFPDDWDRYGADGREIPDSHRYRCMGNAVCVPVAEWLGHRLVAADAWPT